MKNIRVLLLRIMGISLAVLAISMAAEKPIQQFEEKRQEEQEAKREAAEAAKAKKEEQKQLARQLAEARKQARGEIKQAKLQKKEKLAELDRNLSKEELQMHKEQIEVEYKEQLAKIDMKVRLTNAQKILAQVQLPEDDFPRLNVKEIQFSGNTLVSTAEILQNMPIVYNASSEPLAEADSEYLYDFTPLYEVILSPGTSREISARTLQGLTQYVLSVYQKKNYAGIYVYVPEEAFEGQELTDEIVPVEIIEAKVTDVAVVQYDANQVEVSKGYLDPNAVLAWSPVKKDKVANRKKLDDFVNLLNCNPDRYTSAVVSKGSEPQSLAVKYDIYEVNPWHWFLQVDNSGTEERQWSPRIGVINTNLLGIDDSFVAMYQASPESDIGDNYAVYGSYDVPVCGPKLRLNIYGGYSEFDISSTGSDIEFLGSGKYLGADLRYNVLQTGGWFFDVIGSYVEERSKFSPFFADILLFENRFDLRMQTGAVAAELHKRDDRSNARLGYKFTTNMGGSDQDEFNRSRPPVPGNVEKYFKIHDFYGSYSQLLDPNKVTRLSTTLRWIVSEDRLPPAKMTVFGGMYSIRGYDEYDEIADGGLLASVQYEFDIVRYRKLHEIEEEEEKPKEKSFWTIKKLAPLAFFDFGRTKIENPTSSEKSHKTLASVGPGLLIEMGDNFSGNVYYGIPLKETDDTDRNEGRINVGLMMRW